MNIENDLEVGKVDVSPEVSMYNLLESYPYDLGSALSEYVDNSIQAFLDNRDKLSKNTLDITIKVDFSNQHEKKIIISDNCVGMSIEDLKRAMKPAFKPNEQSLNEFGIGMKAASVWIGRKWTLLNRYIDRKEINKCHKIVFDLNELIRKGEGSIPINEIETKENDHGVTIIIEKLNQLLDETQIQDAFLTLEENYQYFIHKDKILNLDLTYTEKPNLQSLPIEEVEEPAVLVSREMVIKKNKPYWTGEERKTWKQNVNFIFNGKNVKGFVLCRETLSHKNPGIKIFREKRLIYGTNRRPYRPIELLDTSFKHASLRFYAELHLDGQKISNNKAKLNINEALFLKALQKQDGVQDILDQSKNYKANAVKEGKVEELPKNVIITTSSKQEPKTEPKNTTVKTPKKSTDILDLVIKNTNDLIVQHIAKEAKLLYGVRDWGFMLCYRVIAEKVIHAKVKEIIPNSKYVKDKIEEKGIVKLIIWLNNNKEILNFNDMSLEKSLNQLSGAGKFEIANLVVHGHYYPTKADVDLLLINTQKLLEWAVSQE